MTNMHAIPTQPTQITMGAVLHHLNNLLMCIQGNAHLISLETEKSSPHFDRLKEIESFVEQAAELSHKIREIIDGG